MKIFSCAVILLTIVVMESAAHAQAGRSYPLVYGATGRPYGPTQAHYQYEKRYGRPWTGNGSRSYNNRPDRGHHHHHGLGHYGPVAAYRSPWVDPFWGGNYYGGVPIFSPVPVFGYQGVIPGVPSVSTSQYYYERQGFGPVFSGTVVPTPFDRGFSDVLPPRPNELDPFGFNAPSLTPDRPLIPPSSPAAQVQALHSMARGDLKLAQMNYLGAADHYRDAVRSARDLAEPRYRLAITHTARTKFQDAVEEFKLAFAVNPDWLDERQSLDQLFGVDNKLGKTEIKHRVADWLLRDSRDPNRLFLLAMMLHLDNDPRAITLVDTAILVAGREPYLLTLKESIAKETPRQPPNPPQPGLAPNGPAAVPLNQPPAPQAQPPVQEGPKLPPLQAP